MSSVADLTFSRRTLGPGSVLVRELTQRQPLEDRIELMNCQAVFYTGLPPRAALCRAVDRGLHQVLHFR